MPGGAPWAGRFRSDCESITRRSSASDSSKFPRSAEAMISTVWARKLTSGEAVPPLITCWAAGSASRNRLLEIASRKSIS